MMTEVETQKNENKNKKKVSLLYMEDGEEAPEEEVDKRKERSPPLLAGWLVSLL